MHARSYLCSLEIGQGKRGESRVRTGMMHCASQYPTSCACVCRRRGLGYTTFHALRVCLAVSNLAGPGTGRTLRVKLAHSILGLQLIASISRILLPPAFTTFRALRVRLAVANLAGPGTRRTLRVKVAHIVLCFQLIASRSRILTPSA